MKDGIILLDTKTGKELGFTSDKFILGSYLWKKDEYIYILFIHSKEKRKGNLSKFFDTILKGYGIKVPNPSALMEAILIKKEFERTEEFFETSGRDVWVKEKNR